MFSSSGYISSRCVIGSAMLRMLRVEFPSDVMGILSLQSRGYR